MKATEIFRPWRTVGIAVLLVVGGIYSQRISGYLNPAAWETIKVILLAFLVHAVERDFLWKNLYKHLVGVVRDASAAVSRENNALIRAAASSGLTRIYPTREKAAQEVKDAIANAKHRVWISAVALSEKFQIEGSLHTLKEKVSAAAQTKKEFDLKILVADPLRSPAVFRSFLETSPEQIGTVVNYPRPKNHELDPFRSQTLYKRVRQLFDLIDADNNIILRDSVRFYAHNPSAWLVIADETAFFEPYTFGLPSGVPLGSCIGSCFPVFKFESSANASSFQILADHFIKLWITTDRDWFHFKARLNDLEQVIESVFKRRGDDWFVRVWKTLEKWYSEQNPQKKDERRCPRMPCSPDKSIPIEVKWGQNGTATVEKIRDFSRCGISLTFQSPIQLKDGDDVTLTLDKKARESYSGQVQFLLDAFLDCKLKVVLPRDKNQFVVGLQKVA